MKIMDRLDLMILREMWTYENITITDIAKRVFKIYKTRDVQDRTSFINKRIVNLVEKEYVIKTNNGKNNIYILNIEKCVFGVIGCDVISFINLGKKLKQNLKRKVF